MSGQERNTLRFFVEPAALGGDSVEIHDRDLARQLSSVLRLRPGAQITLLDGLGQRYTVELAEIGKDVVRGSVVERGPAGGEPTTQLTIYASLIRAERFEWLLQKAVEIGVARIVPLVTARSLPGDVGASKRTRWERIIREASEQSLRGVLPEFAAPQTLEQACAAAGAHGLLLWEGQGAAPLRQILQRRTDGPMALLSGPEGGFTQQELEIAQRHSVQPVTLGPRILRAETAPLVAATAVFYDRQELE